MTDRALNYRRTHNILLIQKLLACKPGVSPFTLILDSVEQSAKPVVAQYIGNAKVSKTDVLFISYETLKPPAGINTFIKARRKGPDVVQAEISSQISKEKPILLILDTLHPLLLTPGLLLPTFLSTLLKPNTTLLATYHLDIPLPLPSDAHAPYVPPPLPLLRYLATTILTPHSLGQTVARHRARERSLPEPVFGLGEERDGVVVGMGAGGGKGEGCVVHLEHRRKSGRGVEESFVFPSLLTSTSPQQKQKIILLDDHPFFRPAPPHPTTNASETADTTDLGGSTFELGLTAKQRKEREGVVLPYFDAQSDEGGGEGGRILYEMGVEDDFDEEEDEI